MAVALLLALSSAGRPEYATPAKPAAPAEPAAPAKPAAHAMERAADAGKQTKQAAYNKNEKTKDVRTTNIQAAKGN